MYENRFNKEIGNYKTGVFLLNKQLKNVSGYQTQPNVLFNLELDKW